jgi:serine/threonine-protein kinase
MDGAAIAPDAAGTLDNTTDGTDAASDTAGTTVTAADTTDSTQTCVEEQASANTAEPDDAAAPSDAAPADAAPTDATTDAPASTPITRADGDRGLQSHASPVATSADGDSSSADARTAALAPEIATVSPPGDAQSTTDLAGEVTSSDAAATSAVSVGQTLDVGSWTGSFGADQWQLESRFTGCLSALSAEGCAFSHVFVGQQGGGLHTAHVRERSPTEAKERSARAQRPESPHRRAPERRLPVPTMPGSSVGSGASQGSHGGAVLGLISAVFGLLAPAGIRALAHPERRPPTPPLISLLERPG